MDNFNTFIEKYKYVILTLLFITTSYQFIFDSTSDDISILNKKIELININENDVEAIKYNIVLLNKSIAKYDSTLSRANNLNDSAFNKLSTQLDIISKNVLSVSRDISKINNVN